MVDVQALRRGPSRDMRWTVGFGFTHQRSAVRYRPRTPMSMQFSGLLGSASCTAPNPPLCHECANAVRSA
jgi:hypothetical protein